MSKTLVTSTAIQFKTALEALIPLLGENLTQKEIADMIGISRTQLNEIISNKQTASVSKMEKIAQRFNTNLPEMLIYGRKILTSAHMATPNEMLIADEPTGYRHNIFPRTDNDSKIDAETRDAIKLFQKIIESGGKCSEILKGCLVATHALMEKENFGKRKKKYVGRK